MFLKAETFCLVRVVMKQFKTYKFYLESQFLLNLSHFVFDIISYYVDVVRILAIGASRTPYG